jgi:hypothetical protein
MGRPVSGMGRNRISVSHAMAVARLSEIYHVLGDFVDVFASASNCSLDCGLADAGAGSLGQNQLLGHRLINVFDACQSVGLLPVGGRLAIGSPISVHRLG